MLDLIDSKLNCTSFLVEFAKSNVPTNRFGGDHSTRKLNGMLQTSATGGSRKALQFLLTEAPLRYPFCRTTLGKGEFNGRKPLGETEKTSEDLARAMEYDADDNRPDRHVIQPEIPGLVSPLRRTESSTILFGCLFPEHTITSIDVAIANKTFSVLATLLSPGLDAFFQIDQERATNRIHRTLLSFTSCPAVLATQERIVLGQTASGIDKLIATGGVSLRDEKLDFKNRRMETCLQGLLNEIQGQEHFQDAENKSNSATESQSQEHAVFIEDPSGRLNRITFGAITPAPVDDRCRSAPWILIRMAEPSELPQAVELALQDYYLLSQSEAHLARYLTMTGSMTDTVEQLGITRNTAKTHMRRIFEKTGINTQLQLARLVHKLSGYF